MDILFALDGREREREALYNLINLWFILATLEHCRTDSRVIRVRIDRSLKSIQIDCRTPFHPFRLQTHSAEFEAKLIKFSEFFPPFPVLLATRNENGYNVAEWHGCAHGLSLYYCIVAIEFHCQPQFQWNLSSSLSLFMYSPLLLAPRCRPTAPADSFVPVLTDL